MVGLVRGVRGGGERDPLTLEEKLAALACIFLSLFSFFHFSF